MHLTDWFEVGQVVVAVAHEDIEFGNILHFSASRLNHRLDIAHNLPILGNDIPCDMPVGIAPRLSCQEKQATTRNQDAMAEPDRGSERWWVDDLFFHTSSSLLFRSFYHVCSTSAHI